MARQQAHQLLPGVAGGAGDGDARRAPVSRRRGAIGDVRGGYGHSVVSRGKRIFIQSDA